MRDHIYWVYMSGKPRNGTLYTGVTSVKRWQRKWKLELIEAQNPQWRDLWLELTEQ